MTENFYGKSGMTAPVAVPKQGGEDITAHEDARGKMQVSYPSLSREGLTSVLLPVRPGRVMGGVSREGPEELLACNLGSHVIAQVERGFKTSPAEAVETLSWYTGAVEGAKLLDGKTLGQLQALSRRFASADKPEEVYATEIRPFLRNLRPTARPKENRP